MKTALLISLLLMGWSGNQAPAPFPQSVISNGIINAVIYLPDSASGYYQATRFDWSGVINSLNYKGHHFISQWFKKYDPKLHDAITGPVEEFEPIGYDNAKAGDAFIKIGVGGLLKKDEKPYSSFQAYDIVDGGKWSVDSRKDGVLFTHKLSAAGIAYSYQKKLQLLAGKPELVIEHRLKNTGKLAIETNVYDHNFYLIDNEPTGAGITVKFPFNIDGTGRGIGTLADIRNGREIGYLQNLKENESVFISPVNGFSNRVEDYDFRIENLKTRAGVRITSDRPLQRMVYWACSTVSCPEPYIHVSVEPGKEFQWTIHYTFYEF